MSNNQEVTSQGHTHRQRTRDLPWDRDSVNGGPTSISILLNWLKTRGNYARWDAASFVRHEREQVCMEILTLMQTQGITHRHAMSISHRIQLLRRNYNTAREFINHARGNGNGNDPILLTYARRVCEHWDRLDPIMGPQLIEHHSEGSEAESTNTS
ncbi:hypothetical protein PGT21_027643 [Puccinia graminis f. sp. tritici]|uniref:Uncharacterized protein n=1 Tax=Puccinia graminis f. sp. tritici TaxID=56615 RepID=A0A5B0QUK2_PUCGR|nr:hypothetical protein PGT21_027643 [Puccinia graminis f. sp. tritici]KAA1116977.1 hypothetical protein PGTUg99_032732 [Puccinia graminis f. sp. tritici]